MGLRLHNLFKLSTREDYFFIHKYLGIFCLINFIYRYYCLFVYGDMNFDNTSMTPFSITLHGLLSVSSLIFRVPTERHKGKPMIYQEFRLHSIIFALRSVFCSLCFYYQMSIYYNVLIINLTMIFADIITHFFKAKTKTMRGMPFGKSLTEEEKKTITRMHSSQQFAATIYMMVNINFAFTPIFAIQIAAFLMTLVRKNIIDELDWHRVYAVALWINIFVLSTTNIFMVLYICFVYYGFRFFRFHFHINKYLLWNIFLYIATIVNNNNTIYEKYKLYCVSIITFRYMFGQIKKSKSLWI